MLRSHEEYTTVEKCNWTKGYSLVEIDRGNLASSVCSDSSWLFCIVFLSPGIGQGPSEIRVFEKEGRRKRVTFWGFMACFGGEEF